MFKTAFRRMCIVHWILLVFSDTFKMNDLLQCIHPYVIYRQKRVHEML